MAIKLIAIDLDGTCLNDSSTIDQANINLIKVLANCDYKIIIATGRPFRASINFHKILGINTPLINFNGACINFSNKKIEAKIDHAIVDEIEHNLGEYLENITCDCEDIVYQYQSDHILNGFFWISETISKYGKMINNLRSDPYICIVTLKDAKYRTIVETFMKTLQGYSFRFWDDEYGNYGELIKKDVNKYNAVSKIAEQYGISGDEIMAIGDAGNDYELIKHSHIGVAMLNAEAQIKSVSDIITKYSNKDGGVAKFLEEYFKIDLH